MITLLGSFDKEGNYDVVSTHPPADTNSGQTTARSQGMVFFVGAGPGDPGLLTLWAAECLKKADCVFADRLVHPEILKFVRPGATIIRLEHHYSGVSGCQGVSFRNRQDIVRWMIAEAQQGKIVVRLKSGSPEIFARQAEEQALLRQAGVPYKVIPGITAGLAAAAVAEIPLTDSDHSSAVALVTGHEKSSKKGSRLDYEVLAKFPGTLVFYMGVSTAQQWSEALIRGGKSPGTPVAIIYRCTWPDQKILRCQLGNLVETIAHHGVKAPAIIIVGDVAAA